MNPSSVQTLARRIFNGNAGFCRKADRGC
ncbi:hypothetical protein PflQ2_0317 [Pseudomonas fluorescens Q2-87]|uniref:Uncharacterized protein n=1 Tax=Pseudomonas fluorescens (strain Q2-87) TaxID=1038922 RepID=J2EQQ5_PSEFQ|nr:hypothetical protein PflQ2_0317 [Pseudomonas fluorescens Q2-87]